MKNIFKVLGIIALMAVTAFSMAACGGDDDSGGGGGNSGVSEGTLVVTDIPAAYNGKYAGFEGTNDSTYLIGAQSVNVSAKTATLVQISNGRVSLPLWKVSVSESVRYYGNDTFPQDDNYNTTWWVGIFNTSTTIGEMDSNAIAGIDFPYSLVLKNGGAVISANTGTIYTH